MVIFGVKDSDYAIIGIADGCLGETVNVVLGAIRQVIVSELVLDPVEPEMYEIAGKSWLLRQFGQVMVQFIRLVDNSGSGVARTQVL